MKLLFTSYFILCYTLFTLPTQAQPSGAAVADSLLRLLAQSRPDTNRVKVLLRLGDYRMEVKSLNLPGFIDLELKKFHLAIAFHQAATNLFCPPQ